MFSIRLFLSIVLLLSSACVGIPKEEERRLLLRQEPFSRNYALAVLTMWIQPPYYEATGILEPSQIESLESRIVAQAARKLPSHATAWARTPRKPALERFQVYRLLEQEEPRMEEAGHNGVLAVVIVPHVVPRNLDFTYTGPLTCKPTLYPPKWGAGARFLKCPYLVEKRVKRGPKRRVIRDVRVPSFEAFLYLRSFQTGELLIDELRFEVECGDSQRYESMKAKMAIVQACFQKVEERISGELDALLLTRRPKSS